MKPSVSAAYILVTLLWSTTPLAIVWSSETVHPTMAVFLRMLIAAVMGCITLAAFKIPFPRHKLAFKLYGFSAIGIYGGMIFSYFSATYLPSGMMSLVFGLAPIISGILAINILGEKPFGVVRYGALFIAIMGLALVCLDKLSLSAESWPGVVFILLGVFFFSLSGVMVKSVDLQINPIATTTGALLVTLPLFAATWWLLDGRFPVMSWSHRSLAAIIYLGVLASFLGFIAYFYVLQKLSATSVSLITLMTPIFALMLGAWLNDEAITLTTQWGALAVMFGLAIYLFGEKITKRYRAIDSRTL